MLNSFQHLDHKFHGDPALQRDNSTTPIHFSFLHELGISFIHTLNSQQD